MRFRNSLSLYRRERINAFRILEQMNPCCSVGAIHESPKTFPRERA